MSGLSSSLLDSARSRSPIRTVAPQRQRVEDSMVCKPLKSLSDITAFLSDPPAWRSLCLDIRPHSEEATRNMDIVRQNHASNHEISLERPQTFCHFDTGGKEVRRHSRNSLPKTLVCHDMANGYHDDCYIDGTSNYDAYTFYNWAVVDIFCYFSHHFVTIPPLGWINTAHTHGVKVIGTVITEWEDGAAIWDKLLADPEEWKGFACHLVAIAKMLKMDGWLLNVENKISKPLELVEFVRYLHDLMHREMVAPLLIWYDSVTVDGALAWQNTLNHKNKAFFDACDGIFTNYSWSEQNIRDARAAAGARARDVFVGVDVWGRNMTGGGQLHTQQAVKIAYAHGLSLAIFAPAWTHEALEECPPDRLRQWLLRDQALWGSLWPFLNTKLPSVLPFSTSFCKGLGTSRRLYGEVVSPSPWYNLRHQQYQPNSAIGPHAYRLVPESCQNGNTGQQDQLNTIEKDDKNPEKTEDLDNPKSAQANDCIPANSTNVATVKHPETTKRYQLLPTDEEPCIKLYLEDSFTGGGCLLINPGEPDSNRLIRLLRCDFYIPKSVVFCVVTKTLAGFEEQSLELVICLKDHRGEESTVELAGSVSTGPKFKELQKYLLLHQPGFYVSVENAYGWKVRYSEVQASGSRAVWAACRGAARGPVLLGHLAVCHKLDDMD